MKNKTQEKIIKMEEDISALTVKELLNEDVRNELEKLKCVLLNLLDLIKKTKRTMILQ